MVVQELVDFIEVADVDMNIFDSNVQLKKHTCAYNGGLPKVIQEPYVNLYVRLTNRCQMKCKFCEYHSYTLEKFDFYKFYYVLNELRKNVRINKISFTGGEPTLEVALLNQCLQQVKSIDTEIFTVVNSNGINIKAINYDFLDSCALSRHDTLESNLEVIFGNDSSLNITNDYLKKLPSKIKEKIHISCNLIKGYIDNTQKMYDFIEAYSKLGIHDFGFVSLMKINDYCKEHFIDFADLQIESKMKNTIKSQEYSYNQACKCANYLCRTDDGELNRLYARYYCDHTNVDSTLVYDINVLRNGFKGKVII